MITSYSLLLVIVLILGIVFHFILSHNVKQELLNENMLSLKNVSEQYSNCYANIYLISKRLANNSSLSRLAEADQGERAFYYNAYITKQALMDMYSDYSLQPIQTYYIHLRHTDYIISYNDFENLYSFYKTIKCWIPQNMRNGRELWNPPTIITIFCLLTVLRPNIHHTEKLLLCCLSAELYLQNINADIILSWMQIICSKWRTLSIWWRMAASSFRTVALKLCLLSATMKHCWKNGCFSAFLAGLFRTGIFQHRISGCSRHSAPYLRTDTESELLPDCSHFLPESTGKRTAAVVSVHYLSRCRRKLFDYCAVVQGQL